MTAERARLGDVEIAYEVHHAATASPGIPVLMVMGFTMPGRAWRFIVPELAAARDVCTFDNRGAGASTATQGPYTMAQLAGDALALMDHLGWQRAHVVGVSMGGMIAQRLALNATARLASLTLIATHAGGLLSIMPPVRGVVPFVQANFLARSGSPERRYRALARMLFPQPWLAGADPAHVEALLRHDFEPPAPEVGRKGQLKAVFGHRAARELGRLQGLPTLIVKPTEDALIAPRHSDRLHRAIPNSRLVVFEGAGHGLIRQVPGELAQVIGEHLAAADA